VPARPLFVTDDPLLVDDLVRVAADAGVEVEVCRSMAAAGDAWRTAPAVVVGPDAAGAEPPSRRGGLVLVGTDLDDAGIWDRAAAVGADHVVLLPDAEPWLTDLLRDAAGVSPTGLVLGVLGGCGGAGASCLAVALALAGARAGHRVVLVDGDPLGGGLDLALGVEDSSGARWPELLDAAPVGLLGGPARLRELPRVAGVLLLSCDRGAAAQDVAAASLAGVLADAAVAADLVVLDLPRAGALPAAVLGRCNTLLLVVPTQLRAVAAAARVAGGLGPATDVRIVVRRTGGPPGRGVRRGGRTGNGRAGRLAGGLGGLDADMIGATLRLPVAGSVRDEPDLDADLARGMPPGSRTSGPLARFAHRILPALGLGPATRRTA